MRLLFTCAGKVASGRDFKSWTETEKPAMSIANWRIRRKFNWIVKNHDKKPFFAASGGKVSYSELLIMIGNTVDGEIK